MCGRYVSKSDAVKVRFAHLRELPDSPFHGDVFNAAPTRILPVIRKPDERVPEIAGLRWGLVPGWAKDPAIGAKMINARGETVADKPAFRAAFKRRRCLVPMAGFYEWQKTPAGKVPHFIHLLNAEIFCVAGLYEYWPGKEGAAPIESYTIITTDANEMMARLHDRMPVIVSEDDYAAWLDPKNENTATLQPLLKPYPSEEMRAYPVSTRVNNPKNDGPELIEPAVSA
jgi:putative SOS response-associated peptidase YedK